MNELHVFEHEKDVREYLGIDQLVMDKDVVVSVKSEKFGNSRNAPKIQTIKPKSFNITCKDKYISYDFVSWADYMMKVCNFCVKFYGEKEFSKKVLNPKVEKFHCKKRDVFASSDENMMQRHHKLYDGMYVLTNYSANDIQRLVGVLLQLFPAVIVKFVN